MYIYILCTDIGRKKRGARSEREREESIPILVFGSWQSSAEMRRQPPPRPDEIPRHSPSPRAIALSFSPCSSVYLYSYGTLLPTTRAHHIHGAEMYTMWTWWPYKCHIKDSAEIIVLYFSDDAPLACFLAKLCLVYWDLIVSSMRSSRNTTLTLFSIFFSIQSLG